MRSDRRETEGAGLTSAEDDRFGPNRAALERRAEAPTDELSTDVWCNLDAGAYIP